MDLSSNLTCVAEHANRLIIQFQVDTSRKQKMTGSHEIETESLNVSRQLHPIQAWRLGLIKVEVGLLGIATQACLGETDSVDSRYVLLAWSAKIGAAGTVNSRQATTWSDARDHLTKGVVKPEQRERSD